MPKSLKEMGNHFPPPKRNDAAVSIPDFVLFSGLVVVGCLAPLHTKPRHFLQARREGAHKEKREVLVTRSVEARNDAFLYGVGGLISGQGSILQV